MSAKLLLHACIVFLLLLAAIPASAQTAKAPVKIIFDTDMDTDCDDAGAMAVLHALADHGECEILGTVVSVTHPGAAPTVAAINAWYGRPNLPIGAPKKNGTSHASKYVDQITKEFPQPLNSTAEARDATLVYRDLLEKEADGSVTVVTVGYLTNLRNLLELPAEGGHASGRDLVKQKVKLYVCMGGNFIGRPAKDDLKLGNVNFTREPASALKVITEWPTPIVFAGREVCSVPSCLQIGRSLEKTPANNPVRRAYEHYFDGKAKDRHVADLVTVLYAVRGLSGLWDMESTGSMDLKPDMTFEWKTEPDKEQSYLLKKKDASGKPNDREVEAVLDKLLIQVPKHGAGKPVKLSVTATATVTATITVKPSATATSESKTSPKAEALIKDAGNAEDEEERLRVLKVLAALPTASEALRADAGKLAEFVERWNRGGLKFYGKQWDAYDFGIPESSPLHVMTALYQGRMRAWQLIENSTIRSSPVEGPKLHQRACVAFRRYQEAFPKNRIPGMYLGQSIPWKKAFPDTPSGAPEWAVLQREQLERMREIIHWWIDHRQKEDGQFGGGWGDDCEMWRWWSSVLLGFEDPKAVAAQLKFSKAAMARPHLKGGFNPEITDVEHAAEDTTDNLIPLMVLEPENAKWQAWALKMGGFMENAWTGRNERGQLQFRSFYISATGTSPTPARALDVIANVGALHPALLAWQRKADPVLDRVLPAWLDTWVEATARADHGKPAGILPSSIRWPDGATTGGEDKHWYEPVKYGGYMHSYYIWPSVITEITDALVIAHVRTGNSKYLEPLRSMAAIRLKWLKEGPWSGAVPGSLPWCAAHLGPRENANSNFGALVKSLARCKVLTGTKEFDELLALESAEFTLRSDASGRDEITRALRASAEAMRVNFPGFTSEVRSTDRVMRFVQFLSEDYQFDDYKGVTQPKHELLYRMVSGDTNAPRFPQMAVRWLTPPQDIAVFVTQADQRSLRAEVFHFGKAPREMKAELRLLKPGRYEARVSVDAAGSENVGGLIGSGGDSVVISKFEVKEGGAYAQVPVKVPAGKLAVVEIGEVR